MSGASRLILAMLIMLADTRLYAVSPYSWATWYASKRIDDKTIVTRLPKPDARQEQILEALQVHLPEK